MKKLILLISVLLYVNILLVRSLDNHLGIEVSNKNNIVVYTTEATVNYEGYSGSKLMIVNEDGNGALNYEKTEGTNNETKIKIKGPSKSLKIKVPENLYLLTIEANSFKEKANLNVKNYKGRLIIHVLMDSINLNGLTGPFYVHSDKGDVILKDINWQQKASWNFESVSPQFSYPYMISSKKSNIKLFLKNTTKGSFKLNSIKGSIHSNVEKPDDKMNGGGVIIFVQSDSGDIFLEQEK